MNYLIEHKQKFYFLFLIGLIISHVYFLSTKSYSVYLGVALKFENITEEQYQNVLELIQQPEIKLKFIEKTEINYAFNLPSRFLISFYIGYFLFSALIILPHNIGVKEKSK
jgi:hypothetical protein